MFLPSESGGSVSGGYSRTDAAARAYEEARHGGRRGNVAQIRQLRAEMAPRRLRSVSASPAVRSTERWGHSAIRVGSEASFGCNGRAQRNCDGGYALRDGCATDGHTCATEGHALRYGWGPLEIRMRYGIHHAATVSERLRRVRYVTGKGRIISLLRPSRKADSRSRRQAWAARPP